MRHNFGLLLGGYILGVVSVVSKATSVSFVDWILVGPRPATELVPLIIVNGLDDFFAGVHHEGTMLHDGFGNWFSLKQEEPIGQLSILNHQIDNNLLYNIYP